MSVGDQIMDSFYPLTLSEQLRYEQREREQREYAAKLDQEYAENEYARKIEFEDRVLKQEVRLDEYVKVQEKRIQAMEKCMKGLEAKLKRKR